MNKYYKYASLMIVFFYIYDNDAFAQSNPDTTYTLSVVNFGVDVDTSAFSYTSRQRTISQNIGFNFATSMLNELLRTGVFANVERLDYNSIWEKVEQDGNLSAFIEPLEDPNWERPDFYLVGSIKEELNQTVISARLIEFSTGTSSIVNTNIYREYKTWSPSEVALATGYLACPFIQNYNPDFSCISQPPIPIPARRPPLPETEYVLVLKTSLIQWKPQISSLYSIKEDFNINHLYFGLKWHTEGDGYAYELGVDLAREGIFSLNSYTFSMNWLLSLIEDFLHVELKGSIGHYTAIQRIDRVNFVSLSSERFLLQKNLVSRGIFVEGGVYGAIDLFRFKFFAGVSSSGFMAIDDWNSKELSVDSNNRDLLPIISIKPSEYYYSFGLNMILY